MVDYAIIGAGKMGGALVQGWAAHPDIDPKSIGILDPHAGEAAQGVIAKGAKHIQSPSELKNVSTLVLAVKPQMFEGLAADIASALLADCLIISIMAGTSLESLGRHFDGHPIIRAMPNTPTAIGAGITGITGGVGVTDAHLDRAEMLLGSSGAVIRVANETLIDAVTAVSGSGPAYVFYMVEALAAAGVGIGLSETDAAKLAKATIIGAGALLDQTGEAPGDLRRAVTSPNGTTQAALDVLMDEGGLAPLMRHTVEAAFMRAKELGKT